MKKFKFRFEKLLSYRRYLEKQKQRELAAIQNMEMQQRRKLKHIAADRSTHQKQERQHLRGKIYPDRLRGFTRYYLLLNKMEISGQEVLRQIEKEVDKKRGELIEASKQKKIYEKLKERHRSRYDRQLNLLLQKENDEVGARQR